jgi:simple sugar transport system permease protein
VRAGILSNSREGVIQFVLVTVSLLLLLVATFLALHVSPIDGLMAIWNGAVGQEGRHLAALSETLVEASPLILTGLSVVIAWRAGMFSIGAEGQLLVGALAATAVGMVGSRIPAPLLTGAMVLAGILAGAAWGWFAGWLRVRRSVQEVISTIMLNYLALYLVEGMVLGPLQERSHVGPYSDPLPDSVLFARLFPPAWTNGMATRLHAGVLIALAVVPVVWLLLYRTAMGFGIRVVGQNADAARTARYPVNRLRLLAMIISGGLAGLAGAIELLGVNGRLSGDFSAGWGYNAIPVALLGGLNPVRTLVAALFFGALTAGTGNLERKLGVSSALINVIQAAAVLAVVGVRAWQSLRSGSGSDAA